MENKALIILLAIFSLMDVAFSFFVPANTIAAQTTYAMAKITVFLIILFSGGIEQKQWRFLRNVIAAYWIGQALLYVYNALSYSDYDDWMANFYNYQVTVIVYTASIISGLWIDRVYIFFKKRIQSKKNVSD